MGKFERNKGNRNERQLVQIFRAYGISAQRVPLSGGTSYAKGDVEAEIKGQKWRIESKVRAVGFKQLYSWLTGNDALVVRADRQEALVVLPLRTFCELVVGGVQIGKDANDKAKRAENSILLAEAEGS